MESVTRGFSLESQPEVFASTTGTSMAVRRAVDAGRARKVGPRLYTRNLEEPLEAVVRRNWQRILAAYFPDAVVVDRSAFEARPAEDGSLFIDAGRDYTRRKPVSLPGLTLRPRSGPGAVTGDMPYLEGLHFSGPARKFLDNVRLSRARGGVAPRTLSRSELEDELVRLAAMRGTDALNELRDQAAEVAGELEAEEELRQLDDLIGAVLGTRDAELSTRSAKAHQTGLGFDPRRIELFETLHARLLREPLAARSEQAGSLPALSFVEAYFSNWIEGTEFELDEAEAIVFRGSIPEDRTEDAHDVLGTFELVNDPAKRGRVPTSAQNLLDLLRSHHALMLERRPAARPGAFKEKPNRAGSTTFVHPDLVAGTLVEGYRFYEALPPGLARAIMMMFLVSEVHPFTDGNGRVGRVLMNAELTAAGLQRIVVPLSFRDDYLHGLRALSRNANANALVRVLDFAQQYAGAIDWSDLGRAERVLAETNAFVAPDEVEETGRHLRLPAQAAG
jgi:hypothetical protein